MPHKDPEARKAYLKAYAARNPAYGRVKAWRKANPEKRAAQMQRYAELHPDELAAKYQRYKEKNQEKILELDRIVSAKYRATHPERVAASKKKYAQENKDVINAAVARRKAAKLKRTPSWLTDDDFWMIEQAYELAAVRTEMFGFAWHVDHVYPLQGKLVSGLHTPLNLQVIPWQENLKKGNKLGVLHG